MTNKNNTNNNKPSLSIIIPAYKEAANLRWLLPILKEEAQKSFNDYEIIVVDASPSLDDTASVCPQEGVKYLQRTGGNEYGRAVLTGIAAAAKAKIAFMDADGSHKPADLAKMYEFADKYDLIIGSRYIKGGATDNSKLLKLESGLLNWLYRKILGVKTQDISNSMRIYDARQLKSLELSCLHFDILEEILIKLHINFPKLSVKEAPIHFYRRKEGVSNRRLFVFIFSFLKTALILRRLKKDRKKTC
ncbi:MAG: glycosyltransferase [Elusimicrobiota bacterium]|jgi:dolichol-phosphate mannosyltransferase|nr:glycosyltransferase [Elusimicrobiota bacterium]